MHTFYKDSYVFEVLAPIQTRVTSFRSVVVRYSACCNTVFQSIHFICLSSCFIHHKKQFGKKKKEKKKKKTVFIFLQIWRKNCLHNGI